MIFQPGKEIFLYIWLLPEHTPGHGSRLRDSGTHLLIFFCQGVQSRLALCFKNGVSFSILDTLVSE